MSNTFSSLSISPKMLQVIESMGFSEMTPIQSASIPLLLEGHDLVGQSQTGSGKSAAFIIPILEKINVAEKYPQAMILCPTRELCDQVLRECRKFAKATPGLIVAPLVGGQPIYSQTNLLHHGAQLLVGTPGRTLDHFSRRNIYTPYLKTLVLDEADRMLEEGFEEEMEAILSELPNERQTIFFSATYPEEIAKLSARHQKNAKRVKIEADNTNRLQIEQYVYHAENEEKIETLFKILKTHPSLCTIIFCRTKQTVKDLGEKLYEMGISSNVLHGDLEQHERDLAMALFRNGSLRVLVATDVAARGLDIDTLELVVNVDLPPTSEVYVHRIGRTGRAGRKGTAVSIATGYEAGYVSEIEELTGVKMIRQNLDTSVRSLSEDLKKPEMRTLVISGGKKDKLRAGDILGALTGPPRPLPGTEIGKIEIHDRHSFVAVKYDVSKEALDKVRNHKVKGRMFKAFIA